VVELSKLSRSTSLWCKPVCVSIGLATDCTCRERVVRGKKAGRTGGLASIGDGEAEKHGASVQFHKFCTQLRYKDTPE